MSKNPSYAPEFRAEAVKRVLRAGAMPGRGGQAMVDPEGDVREPGVAAAKGGGIAVPGSRSVPELEAETARLRKE